MKTTKKRISLFVLCVAMLVPMVLGTAQAASDGKTSADVLNELGLFRGAGTDADGTPIYNLDKTATRIEGLVMLVRLLGEEADALAYTGECPFTDVPTWAERHAAYAYSKGYVNGVTPTTYEPNKKITGHQYAVLILRALGYTEADGDFTYSAAREKAAEVGLLDDASDYSGDFFRGDIVTMSHRALTTDTKDGHYLSTQLAEKIDTKEFTDTLIKHDLADPEPEPELRTERVDYPTTGNYSISVYDANGNLLRRTTYNSADRLISFFVQEIAPNNTVAKRTYYDANGVEENSILFEYDTEGREIKASWHNATGLFQYDVSEYHADGTKTKQIYSPDGTLKSISEYDASGKLFQRKSLNLPPDGRRYSILEYGEANRPVCFTVFNADGTIHQKELYDNEGNLVWEYFRLIDGKTIMIVEYADDRSHTASYYDLNEVLETKIEYDTNGTQVLTTHYYKTGEVEVIIEYNENGEMIRSTHYDRNGKILEVTDY